MDKKAIKRAIFKAKMALLGFDADVVEGKYYGVKRSKNARANNANYKA